MVTPVTLCMPPLPTTITIIVTINIITVVIIRFIINITICMSHRH